MLLVCSKVKTGKYELQVVLKIFEPMFIRVKEAFAIRDKEIARTPPWTLEKTRISVKKKSISPRAMSL